MKIALRQKKAMMGSVSLPTKCMACPAGLAIGTKAQAIWSMSMAKTAMVFS
ncbi:MAG: hypothetical protein IJG58_07150 [Oscillospiraceae bacterium]|nr:hypothetical protein [Oscillospiraceae bacterium]